MDISIQKQPLNGYKYNDRNGFSRRGQLIVTYKNFTDIPVLLRSLGFQNYKYNFSS